MTGDIPESGEIKSEDVKIGIRSLLGQTQRTAFPEPAFRKTFVTPLFGEMKGEPEMCPGCPGTGLHYSLKRVKERHDLLVFSDCGCVSYGAFPPYNTFDYGVCMGGSTGGAHGSSVAGKKGVAVIGDSAFMHSGIGGLINMVNNGSKGIIIIFDNMATAMTGRQPNPATGETIHGRKTKRILLEEICRACGAENIEVVDPYDLKGCEKAIERAVVSDQLSILIARRECALLPGVRYGRARVDSERCTRCLECVKVIRCAALSYNEGIEVNDRCIGCMICSQICPEGAISH